MFSTEGHPVFLLRLRSSTRTSFSILRGYITALLERCILVFKDMLNAKLLPLQTRLRAWAMSKRTRQGLLRPGHWGDPSPIGRQDVDPNPVHTKTSAARRAAAFWPRQPLLTRPHSFPGSHSLIGHDAYACASPLAEASYLSSLRGRGAKKRRGLGG